MSNQAESKVDCFTIIHKSVRFAINMCIHQSKNCNISKSSRVASLKQDIDEMVEFVRFHAHHEDNYIFNQERLLNSRAGSIVKGLEEEHETFHGLEENMLKLASELKAKPNQKTLLKLQVVIAEYQEIMWNHLEKEETIVNDVLNEIYTPAEIRDLIHNLEANITFRNRMLGTKFLFPATTTREKMKMMGELNPSAAKVALFDMIMIPAMMSVAIIAVPLTTPKQVTY